MLRCKKSLYSKRNRRFCKKAKRKISGKLKCCQTIRVCKDLDDDSDDSDDSDDDSSQPPQPSSTPSSTTSSGDNGLVRKWVCEECPGKVLLLCFDLMYICVPLSSITFRP